MARAPRSRGIQSCPTPCCSTSTSTAIRAARWGLRTRRAGRGWWPSCSSRGVRTNRAESGPALAVRLDLLAADALLAVTLAGAQVERPVVLPRRQLAEVGLAAVADDRVPDQQVQQ